MLALHTRQIDLHLRDPFTISRGTELVAHNVAVTLHSSDTGEQLQGLGEAAPSEHYGETRGTVLAILTDVAAHIAAEPMPETGGVVAMSTLHQRLDALAHLNPAAKAAIDMAAYDLLGKRAGLPVATLLGADRTQLPLTSFTIGIDTPERMAQKTQAAAAFRVLKVKVGTSRDIENLAAVRAAAPQATIRVDANAAWSPKQALQMIREIAQFNIEFVEQPVADRDLEGLRLVRRHSPLPIYADESCIVPDDVPRIAGCVDGIVIKLMKCGGIYPALKMIHLARAHGLRIMLGCMIESSLAITAATHLAPLVDEADLDGHLLVSDDPFSGVTVEDGRLVLSTEPGLGVTARAES